MTQRYAKILMALSLAAFAFLVTFKNITDYNSNFAFVQHVLSTDTTFPGNALMYRAIDTPMVWHVGYGGIIFGEGVTCLLFLIGGISMWRARNDSAAAFERSKNWFIAGATVGFLIWFFGFMVVGGQWFAMWQSKTWNGQEAAFKFYVAILGVLLFVNQRDSEIGTTVAGRAPR